MADHRPCRDFSTVVEFLLGVSLMFNAAFIFIWVIGVKISKAQQKELQEQSDQAFGRQLTKYFENWMYKA